MSVHVRSRCGPTTLHRKPAGRAPSGNQHVCENIGSDDEGNQAIVCANLIGADNSSGYYAVRHHHGRERNRLIAYADNTPSGSCIANVWGVTEGDETTDETSIQLPGTDITETLKSNFGTPHTNIGDC